MKENRQSGSLMLIELLLAIMFFAVCAAICLQIFVTARNAGERSSQLNNAVIQAQNAAECWKASGGSMTETAALLDAELTDSVLSLGFDEGWQPAETQSATFRLTMTPAAIGEADISVASAHGEIFSITAAAPYEEVTQ